MKRDAFSLVELAVVLTIVGVMLGGSFAVLKSSRERNYTVESKDKIRSAKDSVIGYAMDYVDLPTKDEFYSTLSPLNGTTDEQKKQFFYFVDPDLANDTDICTFNTTSLQVDIYKDGSVDHTISDVAFVVAEQGVNRNIQTGVNSDSPYIVKVYQAKDEADDNDEDYIIDTDQFDDSVSYVTLSELQKLVDCSANKLKIINENALPRDLDTSTDYLGSSSVSIYADGGYPLDDAGDADSDEDYEWCIENAPSWLDTLECNGAMSNESDCNSASATYNQCTSPSLDGDPSKRGSAGTDMFRVYVKDKTKTTSKSFTITLDTDTSTGGTGTGRGGR